MKYYIERSASILSAVLLTQTLYFKFSAAPESVYIFTALGLEPYGRIAIGILELTVSILLVFRKTSLIGGVLGIAVIIGALFAHFFIIGIVVQDDKGILFVIALVILMACSITVSLQKKRWKFLVKRIKGYS